MNHIMYDVMVIIIFLLIIIGFAILVIKIARGPKKLFYGTKYYGFKKISLSFSLFNTYIMRNFFIQPHVTYQVVYKLKAEQGKITMSLDNQLFKETTSYAEGTCLMTFKSFKPVLKLVGTDAMNGRAEVRVIKQ